MQSSNKHNGESSETIKSEDEAYISGTISIVENNGKFQPIGIHDIHAKLYF